jgi:Tfp pilus assembly protein PilX
MKKTVWKNQEGTVLIIAMLILLALTVIGIWSLSSSFYEIRISGNERFGNAAFYAASGGAEEGVNRLPQVAAYASPNEFSSEATYRSGNMDSSITHPLDLGLIGRAGFEAGEWEFRRFQINATGESFGAVKEVETQTCFGPFNASTNYNY